jgi:6-phosphogluconolactonase
MRFDDPMPISRRSAALLLAGATILPMPLSAQGPGAKEYFVYVGTYTRKASKGIYAYRYNPATGKLTEIGLVAETESPSFLAVHPNRKYLYAVNETDKYNGKETGAVTAFSIDGASGKLTKLNQVESHGTAPCHLVVDQTGKSLSVANYSSGVTAVFPVKNDGGLGEASSVVQHSGSGPSPRQRGPHAHATVLSADNRFLFVADLGADQVLSYRLDPAKASIASNDPAFVRVTPGAGPRHFAFHPNGKFAYANGELTSTVTAFSYDAARGALTDLQTLSTLPADFKGENNSTAEIEVHLSGKFLYVSNRGHNSLAIFSIDPNKGTLTAKGHASTQGSTPRNFAIDPTGKLVLAANQESDTIVVFQIDQQTGQLKPTGEVLKVPVPVCVLFVPVS